MSGEGSRKVDIHRNFLSLKNHTIAYDDLECKSVWYQLSCNCPINQRKSVQIVRWWQQRCMHKKSEWTGEEKKNSQQVLSSLLAGVYYYLRIETSVNESSGNLACEWERKSCNSRAELHVVGKNSGNIEKVHPKTFHFPASAAHDTWLSPSTRLPVEMRSTFPIFC